MKKTLTKTQTEYMDIAGVFHWATRQHYVRFITGAEGRHKRTEYNIPRLVEKGYLQEAKWGRQKVYSSWASTMNIAHGLACTEALIRFVTSKPAQLVIGENHLKGKFGCVPEWAIRLTESVLLFEFCTSDNAKRSGLITRKVNLYNKNLAKIEEAFGAYAVVVFVIDLPRELVRVIAEDHKGEPIYFVDYQSFMAVPVGKQFSAPIYLWRREEHSLGEDG